MTMHMDKRTLLSLAVQNNETIDFKNARPPQTAWNMLINGIKPMNFYGSGMSDMQQKFGAQQQRSMIITQVVYGAGHQLIKVHRAIV